MTDHVFTLKDGRKLGYALYGPGDGLPVFYFHGTPSSRLEPLLLKPFNKHIDEILLQNKLRLIAADRPGIGNSTYNPKGSYLSFTKDMAELADELGITSARSLSWSGGAPFALSQAYHHPQLITRIDIITGFTRSFSEKNIFKNMTANKYYFGTAKLFPLLLRGVMKQMGGSPARKPMPQWLSQWPDPDYLLMKNREERMMAFSRTTTMESVKHTAKGVVHEARLYFEKPGYDLKDIHQPVHFWWGTEDNVVQYVHAEAIEKYVPHHRIRIKEYEGHLSIYINYIEEILQAIGRDV